MAKPYFVAHLAEGSGCAGTSSRGYVLYDEPRTRADVEADWAAARDAEAVAVKAFEAAHPRPAVPAFDEYWSGTRAEHRHAAEAARDAKQRWWSERTEAKEAAVDRCWSERGARLVKLSAGHLDTCGSEYDDHAHADAGHALHVLHEEGCRCMCAAASYHQEELDEPDVFAAYTTPAVLVVVLDDDHPAAAACGAAEFLVFELEDLDQRLDAVAAAHAAMLEARAVRKAGVQRRLATTEAEFDAMTFTEYQAWKSETDHRWPGESRLLRGTDRAQAEEALNCWDDLTEQYATKAALAAAVAGRIWAVGGPSPVQRVRSAGI